MSDKNILLSTKDLCKSFATNGVQNHVLSNINLEIYEGDFTVIMGSSGSGKSTLLYSLSGMDTVTSGEVIYDNKNIALYHENQLAKLRRKDFGFVFQQMNLVSNLTLFENVIVPGLLVELKNKYKVMKEAGELLDLVKIEKERDYLPSQVSGGQQQRTCIARALINHPSIIFADEPTGALNKKTGEEVLGLLTQANQNGQTILMVTHDVKAAARANRILYLEDGSIVGELSRKPYDAELQNEAETQINSWLMARGW